MNLEKDIEKARNELDPMVREIKGLVFFAMSLENTTKMANYYADNLAGLGIDALLAFTKAIVVDYGRLWAKTDNEFIVKLDKSFFPANTPVHDELLELRNKLVAHPDKEFETLELMVGGTTFVNERRDPKTHDNVFVAFNTRAEVKGAMWWIKDSATAQRIRDHVADYRQRTYRKLSDVARLFVSACQRHTHVVKELNDLFSIREFTDLGEGKRRQPDMSEGPLSVSDPKPLKIGRTNLMETVSIYESGFHKPSEKVVGPGFTIEVGKDGKFNVTFNSYDRDILRGSLSDSP